MLVPRDASCPQTPSFLFSVSPFAAAWGSGAHGTLPDPPRGSDPFSNTPSSSAFDPPTGRPAGGGSGWGFDEVKHDGGVGFAGAGADGDVPAMGAARGQEEDLARALVEARKELEEAREAAEILRWVTRIHAMFFLFFGVA